MCTYLLVVPETRLFIKWQSEGDILPPSITHFCISNIPALQLYALFETSASVLFFTLLLNDKHLLFKTNNIVISHILVDDSIIVIC